MTSQAGKQTIAIHILRMTSQAGKQTITIHILPDISKGRGSHKMKFGQLSECNMKNISPEKSCTKWGGETSPRPFLKNQNWVYLWINSVKYRTIHFYCISKSRATKIYWNWVADHLLKKTKIGLELVSLPNFKNDFWKIISHDLHSIKTRCPLKKNSVVASDHCKKFNSSSMDISLELKRPLIFKIKNNLLFFTIGIEKVFNWKSWFFAKTLLLQILRKRRKSWRWEFWSHFCFRTGGLPCSILEVKTNMRWLISFSSTKCLI